MQNPEPASTASARYWLAVVIAIAAGVALRASVLQGGVISDDWDHCAMAHGWYPVARSPLDLFSFVRADRGELAPLQASGRMPWWADSQLRLSFLRPLASAMAYGDYAWLDAAHEPWRAHLESLLVWVVGALVLAGLLARVLPLMAAAIASLLFVLDDAHTVPLAWSASRCELLGFVFSVGMLWAHVVWSQRGGRVARGLAIALAWLAVFAGGEHALALFAYLGAYALCASDDVPSLRRRLLDIVPLALPLAIYLTLHVALGFGAAGSSFYADPLSDPRRYFARLPAALALLFGDVVVGFASDWHLTPAPFWASLITSGWVPLAWLAPERLRIVQLSLGALAGVVALLALVHVFRADEPRALRWLLLGAVLSMPPLCGVFPMSRLTVTPALGVQAGLAWVVVRAVRVALEPCSLLQRMAAGAMALAILAVHGAYAAQLSHAESAFYAGMSRPDSFWREGGDIDRLDAAGRHVFVFSAQDLTTQYSLPFVRRLHGLPPPASSQMLLPPTFLPSVLVRVAPNVLELRSTSATGHFGFRNSSYRLENDDFHAGQRIAVANFEVEVVAVTHDGTPTSLRFRFDKPLEDASYLFAYPQVAGLLPLALPRVGESVQLAPPVFPR